MPTPLFSRRTLLSFVAGIGLTLPLLAAASPAPASPPPLVLPAGKPRVGVVLGGGGARGFAHIGVLRELERLRIPIACMAGTSAGSLVGGFYAKGVSLDAMQAAFDSTDWDTVLSGKIKRPDLPYTRKRDDYRNYFDVLMGFRDGGLRFPRAAVSSQEVDQVIRRLAGDTLLPTFADLPIPFEAIATDLISGDVVVFKQGDLAIAQRASMAVPGVFEPVKLDGRLLVDGGMARQLPIENLKGQCADVVIAIDVGTPSLKLNEVRSFVDVLSQYTNIGVVQNVKQQEKHLTSQDLLIRPDLGEYTAGDFKHHRKLAELGEKALAPLTAALQRYAVSEADYTRWQDSKRARLPQPTIIDRVTLDKTQYVKAETLRQQLPVPLGQPLDAAALEERIDTLYAKGDFERVGYRFFQRDGQNVLNLMPLERAAAPNYLRAGLGLSANTATQNDFTLLFSSQHIWLNALGGEWRNYLAIGRNAGIASEFYQPLGLETPWFASVSLDAHESSLPVFGVNKDKLGRYTVRQQRAYAEIGLSLGNYGELRGGVFRGNARTERDVGDPRVFVEGRESTGGLRVRGTIDQFDNPKMPREGYMNYLDIVRFTPFLGSEKSYATVQAGIDGAKTFDRNTVRATLKYASVQGRDRSPFALFSMGGFLNLSGLQEGQLMGGETLLARLMAYRQIAALPSGLGSGFYAGMSLEAGRVRDTADRVYTHTGWLPAGSVFVAADTLLGPLFLGVGKAQGNPLTGYLFLGSDF